ncbi:TauD/TfdA dioxygenase family protein [Amycolatopsis sp. NPDC088138]|uniref:TauD/TfdA dioxygenase family protein n=1 Tax=Amycolatopsis sp. NPDC088138 TaxID=3363938 RepID=UPI00380AD06B
MPEQLLDPVTTDLVVKPVAGHIGADIEGVDLAGPLDETTIGAVREALLRYKVVFFRDQWIDHEQHVALGRRFGDLTRRPNPQSSDVLDKHPEIFTVSPHLDVERYGEDYEARFRSRWTTAISGWHTDMSHAVNPPAASILRAEQVPPAGGDTHWANLVAAYEGLSEPLRELADGLRAEHSFFAGYKMVEHDPLDRSMIDMIAPKQLITVHPVVRVHPETGERALFVNPSRTDRIVGLSPTESRRLLDLFFEQVTRAEYTVRLRWAPGTIAFWDNRATIHLAAMDNQHLGHARVLHRVTVVGDTPVGPDGFVSQPIAGQRFDRPA